MPPRPDHAGSALLSLAAQTCPSCGGAPTFDPGRDPLWRDTLYGIVNRLSYIRKKNQAREFERARLKTRPSVTCRMCGRSEQLPPIGAAPAARHRLAAAPAQMSEPEHAGGPEQSTSSCAQCGTSVPVSGTVVAAVCGSCGNTLINRVAVEDGAHGAGIDGILPLAIDEVTARRRLMQRAHVLRVPAGQRSLYREAPMRLTYYPYVVFAPDPAAGPARADAPTRDGPVAPTSWADVAGHQSTAAGDAWGTSGPVLASESAASALPEEGKSAVPSLYGATHAVAFRPEYLAGGTGIGPDAPVHAYQDRGRDKLIQDMRATARELEGDVPPEPAGLTYRVILAPAYTGAVTIDDTEYRFWVDGTTGIAQAEVPGTIWAIPVVLLSFPLILGAIIVALAAAILLSVVVGWAIFDPLR